MALKCFEKKQAMINRMELCLMKSICVRFELLFGGWVVTEGTLFPKYAEWNMLHERNTIDPAQKQRKNDYQP